MESLNEKQTIEKAYKVLEKKLKKELEKVKK